MADNCSLSASLRQHGGPGKPANLHQPHRFRLRESYFSQPFVAAIRSAAARHAAIIASRRDAGRTDAGARAGCEEARLTLHSARARRCVSCPHRRSIVINAVVSAPARQSAAQSSIAHRQGPAAHSSDRRASRSSRTASSITRPAPLSWLERFVDIEEVTGSSPVRPTKKKAPHLAWDLHFLSNNANTARGPYLGLNQCSDEMRQASKRSSGMGKPSKPQWACDPEARGRPPQAKPTHPEARRGSTAN